MPPEQEQRILKRCGYSDEQIAAMDSIRRASEIREAIECGIYIGALPPPPIDDTEHYIYVDSESGKFVELADAAERGVSVKALPTMERKALSFKDALARFLRDETLERADRKHLKRWAKHDRMEEPWNEIQRCCPRVIWAASTGWFIWHVLVARRAAESVDDHRQRERLAEKFESVITFLRTNGRTVFPPENERHCEFLEDQARRLREPEEFRPFDPIHISRKGKNTYKDENTFRERVTSNSRQLRAFKDLMRNHLTAIYGQPLNATVATLTEIAFPGQEVTIDQVRPPRRRKKGAFKSKT